MAFANGVYVMSIPKIIHYCWLSNDPIPELYQRCMDSWKQKLHDYEFILWDTERFDINMTDWTKQALKAKHYASAADYIRLYAVYHFGGIYLDMDVEVVKPFDDILNCGLLLARENHVYNYIEAGCFGASKNHQYIKKGFFWAVKYYFNKYLVKKNVRISMNITYDTIPIVFAANNYFVPYTSATIQSIMENADTKRKYHFYILNTDITQPTSTALCTQVSRYSHFSIDFVNVSQFIAGYDFFTANRPDLTKEVYFRLLIPELLPSFDKVIYLDGDMICLSDIGELYDIDLCDNLLGAVRDIAGINRFLYEGKDNSKDYWDLKSNMNDVTDYYNDGMVVFNTRLFHQTISTTELINLALSRKWKSHDQDVLNFVSEGKTSFLPYNWNFITLASINYLPEHLNKEYIEAKDSPKIIHFAGIKDKPWAHPFYVTYFEYFWMYATRTPFINVIISRMLEKRLISISFIDFILNEIKHRRNGGIRFFLKCIKALLQINKT
jgi:lipopolysaccharide biosynthesis glycosyltransferase